MDDAELLNIRTVFGSNGHGEITTWSDSSLNFQANAAKKFCMEETSRTIPRLRGLLLDQARAEYP